MVLYINCHGWNRSQWGGKCNKDCLQVCRCRWRYGEYSISW